MMGVPTDLLIRDLVGLMLVSVAGVNVMLGWFLIGSEVVTPWPPPRATLGLRLATFFVADAVVYLILGLRILVGVGELPWFAVAIVLFSFWATIALFHTWAGEGEFPDDE